MREVPTPDAPKDATDLRAGGETRDARGRDGGARQRESAVMLRLLAALAFAGTGGVAIDVHARDLERGHEPQGNRGGGGHIG